MLHYLLVVGVLSLVVVVVFSLPHTTCAPSLLLLSGVEVMEG